MKGNRRGGRPPEPNKRNCQITVRLTGDQYDRLRRQAGRRTVSALVRERALGELSRVAIEFATLEWPCSDASIVYRLKVDWFNYRCLLEPIGHIPPAEAETNFYAALETEDVAAQLTLIRLR